MCAVYRKSTNSPADRWVDGHWLPGRRVILRLSRHDLRVLPGPRGPRVRTVLSASTAWLAIVLGCTLTLNEPDEQSPAEKRRELEKNRAVWEQSTPHDYRYRLQIECGACSFWGHFVVDVRSDTTSVVVRDTSEPGRYSEDSRRFVPAIGDLFNKAANALAMGAPRVEVSYNEAMGYPERVFIDYSDGPDDEYTYRADSVREADKVGVIRVPVHYPRAGAPVGTVVSVAGRYRSRHIPCSAG